MGHRRRALLSRAEIFLGFADVSALEIADFRGEFLEGAGNDGQRRHILGVAVALDDLCRELRGGQSQFLADHLLDARVDVGVSAHRAGELAHSDDLLRMLDALDVAVHLVHPEEQLQTEGHRLGVDAVGAPDAGRVLEFYRASRQHRAEFFQVVENDVRRFLHHHAEGGVLDVAGGQPLVDVFRIVAHVFRHVRQKGDDVVVRDFLDLMDALEVEIRLLTDILRGFLRDLAQLGHGFAGGNLHGQDFLEFMSERPELSHLRIRITFNHVRFPPLRTYQKPKGTLSLRWAFSFVMITFALRGVNAKRQSENFLLRAIGGRIFDVFVKIYNESIHNI